MKEILSIIVPVYNAENYLKECIDSILGQKYSNIELILVNDGSKDSSLSICNEYKKNDFRVKVIDKQNEGVSIARNVGIEAAKGKYIGFVDSDDLVMNDTFFILIEKLKKYPEVKFVSFMPEMVYPNGEKKYPVKQEAEEVVYDSMEYRKHLYLETTNVACWSKLFRADFIKKYRFPKYKVNEDFYLLYSMTKQDIQVLSINNVLYKYMIRNGSLSSIHSSRKDAVENAMECMNFEEKNSGLIDEACSLFFIQCDYYFDKLKKENIKNNNIEFIILIKSNLRKRLLKIWNNPYLYGKQKIRLIKNCFFY